MTELLEYPPWATKLMAPELELASPKDYDYTKLKLWEHPKAKTSTKFVLSQLLSRVEVCHLDYWTVYGYLRSNELLPRCLGLLDGLRIIEERIDVLNVLGVDEVMLWRSAVEHDNLIKVPVLSRLDGAQLGIYWDWRYPVTGVMYLH